MKRVFTVLAPVIALALVAVGMYVSLHWDALSTFPGMPSSYEAKEYCSCRWVSERDDAFCSAYVAQSTVPMQGRIVDEEAHTVTSRALWVSNTARFVDRRHGCVLDR